MPKYAYISFKVVCNVMFLVFMSIMQKSNFKVPITNLKIFVSQEVLMIEGNQYNTTIGHVHNACT